MDYAQRTETGWKVLAPGEPVHHGEIVTSYTTVSGWSDEERDAWGIEPIGDGDPPPAGSHIASTTLGSKNGHPVWVNTFARDEPPAPVDPIFAVEAEKTRRIEAGFPFKGKVIQSRAEDRENIAGARLAAQDAKVIGADPGDFGWQRLIDPVNGVPMFAWITADNTLLPLDADDMIAMGYAAMFHKQRMIFDAKAIKDRLASGENVGDVTRDELWPV